MSVRTNDLSTLQHTAARLILSVFIITAFRMLLVPVIQKNRSEWW